MKWMFWCRLLQLFLTAAGYVALAACAAPPLLYVPSSNLTAQTGASIIGSMEVDPNPLIMNTHVILMSVDNQNTNFGWQDWKTATLITPGMHLLKFGPCQCGYFVANGPSGSVTLAANFAAGKSYVLHSTLPASKSLLSQSISVAWITDQAGVAITPQTPLPLAGPAGPAFVPVFIPTK